MAGLQTSVGLISGIDIQGVVEQLIAIEAVPRDNLQTRTERLEKQQAALLQLIKMFDTTTYMMRNLGKVEVFTRRDVKSSNESVLKATRTSNPQPGSYQFTPLKLAQSQTTLSDGVASDKTALGKEGEITIKFGRDLETNYSLSEINGGYGFDRGYIRITDATGARANIDLRTAQSMEDILDAINSCIDIDVSAEMEGDHLKLVDYSGGTGKIVVQEVNNGTTAASLGLLGSEVTYNEETKTLSGYNLLYLGADMDLNLLNDGNGLSIHSYLDDLTITLSNGRSYDIDFSELIPATDDDPQEQTYTRTVGDLLDVINKAGADAGTTSDGKPLFQAQFREDGKGFEIIDNTGDTGMTISQHSLNPYTQNPILYQLGFAEYGVSSVTYTGGTATGRAVLGDMDSSLLSSLNGGRGFKMETIFENVDDDGNAILVAQDREGNYSYITISRQEFSACETLNDLTRMLNQKFETAVHYVPDTNPPERIPELDADNNIQIVKYGNGNIKYETDPIYGKLSFDEHKFLSEIEVDTDGTPKKEGASWIYEDPDDDTSQIIGYQDDEIEYIIAFESTSTTQYIPDYTKITSIFVKEDTVEHEVPDEFQDSFIGAHPLLDKSGNLITKTEPQLWDGLTVQVLEDSDWEFKQYVFAETEEDSGIFNITGYEYEYLDEDGVTVLTETVTFSEDAVKFLLDNGFGTYDTNEGEAVDDAKFPILANGEIATSTHVSTVPTVTFDYLHSEDYQFTVEWVYDDETLPEEDRKVVGYNVTRYGKLDLQSEGQEELLAELQEHYDAGKMPVLTNNGQSIQYSTPAKTVDADYVYMKEDGVTPRFVDGSDPITVENFTLETVGIQWSYEGDDPNNKVVGYYLGDGLYHPLNSTELESIANSPDGNKYPLLELTESYVYQTGLNLKFQVNADKTGLELVSTGESRNGTILFGDLPSVGGHVSAMLGFGTGVSANATKIVGGDLHMQTVSSNTKLSDMNGGAGIDMTGVSIMIIDSASASYTGTTTNPHQRTIDLSEAKTIGDVLTLINTQGPDVLARINAAGDGIIIEDLPGGTGTFSVTLVAGDQNVLKQLGIAAGTAQNTFDTDGNITANASLSGSTKYSITVEKEDTLDDIREKINDLGIAVQATVINDGSGKPYRLSIASTSSGAAGTFKTDLSAIGLGTTVMSKAQDAVLLYGDSNTSTSLLVSSSTNTFSGIVPGISLSITSTSKEPISVWTENSSSEIKTSLSTFVENYNSLRDFYNEVTLVDTVEGTKGILAMDPTIQRLERDMSELLLQIFNPNGPVRCLQDLGISLTPVTTTEEGDVLDQYSGKIAFDESVFDLMFESNPSAIQEFFARSQEALNDKGEIVTEYVGYASKWENLWYSYSYDPTNSTLYAKYNSLQTQVEKNQERLDYLQERLDVKQELLLKKFYAMETALASMQSDIDAVSKIGTSSSTTSTTTS